MVTKSRAGDFDALQLDYDLPGNPPVIRSIKDEIREIFLQVAIYCGVPAGVDSFRTAREVFAQIDAEAKGS